MVAYHDLKEDSKLQYLTKENQTLRKELKSLNESLDVLVSQIKLEKQKKNPVKH